MRDRDGADGGEWKDKGLNRPISAMRLLTMRIGPRTW